MARKKSSRKKAAKKAPPVRTYKVPAGEPEKKAFDGYIKHPWHKLLFAATIGAIIGWLFRRR